MGTCLHKFFFITEAGQFLTVVIIITVPHDMLVIFTSSLITKKELLRKMLHETVLFQFQLCIILFSIIHFHCDINRIGIRCSILERHCKFERICLIDFCLCIT